MSDMLSIATSGLRAYQTALTTTSENIANSGTAGYVRRSATVREVGVTGQTSNFNGMGVTVSGINRQTDVYRSGQVRSANAELTRSQTSATWLDRIQNSLTANKLSSQLTAFFTTARTAAADPAGNGPRQALLEAASSVAAAFTATGAALSAASEDLEASMDASVRDLNGLSTTLARVNFALGNVSPNTSSAASLLDQRDHILEQMSGITDVSVELDDAGRATVRAGGANGAMLVQGVTSASVTAVHNAEGEVSYSAFFAGNPQSLNPSGGALKGIVESGKAIVAAREQLSHVAKTFAEDVNKLQDDGDTLTADNGPPMFAIGDPESNLTMILSDPRDIAAAGRDKGNRDNSNLLKLEGLRGETGAEQMVTGLITNNGAALNARKGVVDAQSAIRENAVMSRDAISGVNVDEEAVDLIRFQQAYQASSRVIQVARDVLQSILEIR